MSTNVLLLGRGIYDTVELARLTGRSTHEVDGWASTRDAAKRLLWPLDQRLFSFYDLVTAKVVGELRDRGVPLSRVRAAHDHLAAQLGVDRPLAAAAGLQRLATAGRDVYFDVGGRQHDWVDAGRGGQTAFALVVAPLIKRLEFDSLGMVSAWRPAALVLINPGVQAGAPCVDGTRVTTSLIAELASAGEEADDIALDYDLDVEAVHQALDYELALSHVA